MTEPEPIDPTKLQSGPIRHESLSPALIEHIGAVYGVLGPYLGRTLEQFEITFMRDENPVDEVVIWMSITGAWIDYHDKYLDGDELPEADEKKLIAALISISTGVDDAESLGVPPYVGAKLLECYDALGEE